MPPSKLRHKTDALINQFFEAGGVFEDSLGDDSVLFFNMAVGKIFQLVDAFFLKQLGQGFLRQAQGHPLPGEGAC